MIKVIFVENNEIKMSKEEFEKLLEETYKRGKDENYEAAYNKGYKEGYCSGHWYCGPYYTTSTDGPTITYKDSTLTNPNPWLDHTVYCNESVSGSTHATADMGKPMEG